MPTSHSPHPALEASRRGRPTLLATLLCTLPFVECAAPQVQPPGPELCPQESIDTMYKLKILGHALDAIIDFQQPGDWGELGEYRDGPVIGQITMGVPELPEGTLLYGQIWTGPGIRFRTGFPQEGVIVRYHLAQRPDGKRIPVCIVLGDVHRGRIEKEPGSRPGVTLLSRKCAASPVTELP